MDRERYAFLMLSMSMSEAKALLGFDPEDSPSKSEVNRAWKRRIFEKHPDRGGDQSEAVELNVARDILEGKARPSYERGAPSAPAPAPVRYEKPERTGQTFEQAESKAGVPNGVAWLFVTDRQKGSSWSSDESSKSENSWVAYGKKDGKQFFVGMKHYYHEDFYIGGTRNTDTWTMKVQDYSDEAKSTNPSWVYGKVVKALKSVEHEGRFNSKVVDADGWRFVERMPKGHTTSIKHWLVNSGQVSSDDAAVVGRKQVVEMVAESMFSEEPGYYPEAPARWNTWDGGYHGDYWKVSLRINGKEHPMSAGDFLRFSKLKIGGKQAMNAIFGRYAHQGGKKNLTRIRAGKALLKWMGENFKDMPDSALVSLAAASEQMK